MKLNGSQLRLYAVTDRAWAADEDALMDQIAAASVEQLLEAPGMTRPAAEAVYRAFHS